MRNITVLNNRLDESNGTVEHVLEMKAKKMPWYLLFAPKAKGLVSFVQNLLSPLTQKEGVRGGQLSAFFQSAAAVVVGVVGIGLLVGSISLLSEPVQTGPSPGQTKNVCAPVVHYVEVTNDGSSGLSVSVDILQHGWEMFRRWFLPSETGFSRSVFLGYTFVTKDAVRHYPLERRDFYADFSDDLETWDEEEDQPVHFDYFVRGGSGGTRGSGGQYFSMRIKPEHFGLEHVRGEHYHTLDHWVDITLYVTDRDSKGKRMPVGKYNMHCWVSDSDGNGYYVTVYYDGDGDGTFEQAF